MRPIPARWSPVRSRATRPGALSGGCGSSRRGRPPTPWRARQPPHLERRIRAGIVIAPTASAPVPPFRLILARTPAAGIGQRRGGTAGAGDGAAHSATTDRLLVLLSGGASSLMAVPATGITLEDKRHATAVLLRSGADIHALNTVRKHMSAIKGGRLAAAAAAECHTLAVSDVIGDDLSFIGSGPTVADAVHVCRRARRDRRLRRRSTHIPPSVVAHLDAGMRGERPETPKPGDPRLARSRCSGHRWAFQRDARRGGRGANRGDTTSPSSRSRSSANRGSRART